MVLVYTEITLKNPRKPELDGVKVAALADTGLIHLVIPEHVRLQLELEESERKEVIIANGQRILAPYVGPVEIHFQNRTGFTGAIVMGETALLDAIPMEDMDLVVVPRTREIKVNPNSPNIAASIAM